ncbi:MAG: hypothetical protein L3J93_01470 [Thermoplasmata archaeon]|nr:hypothetical protein [Thermoplasmata archaeon]
MNDARPGDIGSARLDAPYFRDGPSRPAAPLLVVGPASFALLNGVGELRLPRETRGADVDWGGIYAQGIRLTGPWRIAFTEGGSAVDLDAATLARISNLPGGAEAVHQVGGWQFLDRITPSDAPPGIVRTIELAGPGSEPNLAGLTVSFEPFLAPVLIEGIRPEEIRAVGSGRLFTFHTHGFAFAIECDPAPTSVTYGGDAWSGVERTGEPGLLTLAWDLDRHVRGPSSVRIHLYGGLESSIRPARALHTDASDLLRGAGDLWEAWISSTPTLEFPDAPELELAYRTARTALRMLYTSPAPGIDGLVAGFPWYSSLWGRDLAWMIPAVAWLGDFAWAERSLATAFRFQAHANIPILGAAAGEIPMQLSPGPIFLYGTSDTTLYYPCLVRQHAEHTGATEFAQQVFPSLSRIVDWGLRKGVGGSALVTNGGEVAVMRHETEVGRVHVGIDAADTTIWDSTDRRDHAIDVQVLWADCLEAIESLARALGHDPPANLVGRATAVRNEIRERYLWSDEGYLYDSIREGKPVRKVRPNALRAVSAGILEPDLERALVLRAAKEDLTTAWGVRTLSSTDASYNPTAYHDGQVWTIATAWAASAALRAGEHELGVAYLRTIALRYLEEGGYANECYRGDRAEPFNSCFLLGFSVAPFLSTLFDSLWGIRPEMSHSVVRIDPRFPATWRSARLANLSLGRGKLSIDWTPGRMRVIWNGPSALGVTTGSGSVVVQPGVPSVVSTPSLSKT